MILSIARVAGFSCDGCQQIMRSSAQGLHSELVRKQQGAFEFLAGRGAVADLHHRLRDEYRALYRGIFQSKAIGLRNQLAQTGNGFLNSSHAAIACGAIMLHMRYAKVHRAKPYAVN